MIGEYTDIDTPAWHVCVHEASHAAADLVLGAGVRDIMADGDTGLGWCKPIGLPSALACLAGPAGEWRLDHGDAVPSLDDFRHNANKADIARAVRRIGSDDPELLRLLWIEAAKLISAHWAQIEAIARALQAHGRLDGDEVTTIWHQAANAP